MIGSRGTKDDGRHDVAALKALMIALPFSLILWAGLLDALYSTI